MIEPVEERRVLAQELGAVLTLGPEDCSSLDPDGYPVVIEATGSAPGLSTASSLVAIDGVLGVMGYHQSNEGMRTVPMERWNFKAITVKSLHHRDFHKMLRWVDRAQRAAGRGTLRGSTLVDIHANLAETAEILDPNIDTGTPLKAVLDMSKTAS